MRFLAGEEAGALPLAPPFVKALAMRSYRGGPQISSRFSLPDWDGARWRDSAVERADPAHPDGPRRRGARDPSSDRESLYFMKIQKPAAKKPGACLHRRAHAEVSQLVENLERNRALMAIGWVGSDCTLRRPVSTQIVEGLRYAFPTP